MKKRLILWFIIATLVSFSLVATVSADNYDFLIGKTYFQATNIDQYDTLIWLGTCPSIEFLDRDFCALEWCCPNGDIGFEITEYYVYNNIITTYDWIIDSNCQRIEIEFEIIDENRIKLVGGEQFSSAKQSSDWEIVTSIGDIFDSNKHIHSFENIVDRVEKNAFDESDPNYHSEHSVKEIVSKYCTECDYVYKDYTTSLSSESHNYVNNQCSDCSVWDQNVSDSTIYFALLNAISSDENPMDNDKIVSIMRNRYKLAGVNDESVIDELIQIITNAPKIYRDSYLYTFFSYNLIISDDPNGTSQYQRYLKTLTINKKHLDNMSTWFHESGHAIDYLCDDVNEEWKNKSTITQCLNNDATSYISGNISDYISNLPVNQKLPESFDLSDAERKSIISCILSPMSPKSTFTVINGSPKKDNTGKIELNITVPNNLSATSKTIYKPIVEIMCRDLMLNGGRNTDKAGAYMGCDIMEGITNGTLFSGVGHIYNNPTYWYVLWISTNYIVREAWAEYYSSQMIQDVNAIKSNERYFSTACKEMHQRLSKMWS